MDVEFSLPTAIVLIRVLLQTGSLNVDTHPPAFRSLNARFSVIVEQRDPAERQLRIQFASIEHRRPKAIFANPSRQAVNTTRPEVNGCRFLPSLRASRLNTVAAS